ncbi:hypothetical protein KN10_0503 [Anoxybacillus flavithermus NBRC 109594]|uniref:Uncharacterized protein n=1 Tax=Anoxybacillus flavithermus NBRC 109594 TaxID=1315967 RepID=R4G5X1_9BACL|nr:hypothetical protein KN10_0503 [Anoxybacillus flavithermus NBRC 109594]
MGEQMQLQQLKKVNHSPKHFLTYGKWQLNALHHQEQQHQSVLAVENYV